jgi:excisionase family DNA binding protein
MSEPVPVGRSSMVEVAKHFGISLTTVKRMVADGKLPHLHIGRRRIFNIPQLEKHFAQPALVKANTP